MATTYKTLTNSDVVSTRTLLHESIPITGSVVSGSYSENNIKNYAHGMFQSVYDYPFLSSSANHVIDITAGYSAVSKLSGSTSAQNAKKINIYNQMAQVLMGYDHTGSIQRFDEDGNILAGGTKLDECYFLNFSRLIIKDEVKKGSFQLELGVRHGAAGHTNPFSSGERILIHDISASNDFRVNSPAGEYGILQAVNAGTGSAIKAGTENVPCGLIFYQAGIAVISGSVFNSTRDGGILAQGTHVSGYHFAADKTVIMQVNAAGGKGKANSWQQLTASQISGAADSFRRRIYNLQFNNTTELNSTIYFCRVNHNDFNYSANPTYLENSQIRVKNTRSDMPSSYITTIGLYSADNELLAVAKVSEPLKKDPTTELTLRVRLDY